MKHRFPAAALVTALAIAPLALTVTAAAAPAPTAAVTIEGPEATPGRIEALVAANADRVAAARQYRESQAPEAADTAPGARTLDSSSAAEQLAAASATERIAGDSRYTTAIAISQDVHPDPFYDFGGIVFIANGMNFPDALAAGPAAASQLGPILLVPPTGKLPIAVRDEIERLDPFQVVIIGKTDNVSQQTEDDLRAMFPTGSFDEDPVIRIAGDNRYETSAYLSLFVSEFVDLGGDWYWADPDTAYIANGLTFADALAGGAAGGWEGAPLFLTAPGHLDPSVEFFLEPLPADPEFDFPGQEYTTVRILGSSASVSDAVLARVRQILPNATVIRYPGKNRFETAAMLNADVFGGPVDGVTMTNGLRFPDALAGATRANVTGGPTVLTQTACVPPATIGTLEALQPVIVTALGKTDAVSEAALAGLACAG